MLLEENWKEMKTIASPHSHHRAFFIGSGCLIACLGHFGAVIVVILFLRDFVNRLACVMRKKVKKCARLHEFIKKCA